MHIDGNINTTERRDYNNLRYWAACFHPTRFAIRPTDSRLTTLQRRQSLLVTVPSHTELGRIIDFETRRIGDRCFVAAMRRSLSTTARCRGYYIDGKAASMIRISEDFRDSVGGNWVTYVRRLVMAPANVSGTSHTPPLFSLSLGWDDSYTSRGGARAAGRS